MPPRKRPMTADQRSQMLVLLCVIEIAALLTGCERSDRNKAATSETITTTTHSAEPTSSTSTANRQSSEDEIRALVDTQNQAVINGDKAAYAATICKANRASSNGSFDDIEKAVTEAGGKLSVTVTEIEIHGDTAQVTEVGTLGDRTFPPKTYPFTREDAKWKDCSQ